MVPGTGSPQRSQNGTCTKRTPARQSQQRKPDSSSAKAAPQASQARENSMSNQAQLTGPACLIRQSFVETSPMPAAFRLRTAPSPGPPENV